MVSSRLSPLQQDLLAAFFERTPRFFLTGGAALAGFYLGHRETRDLDLFTTPGADLEEGARALRSAVAHLGADAKLVQTTPDFRRFEVSRGDETTLVDLKLLLDRGIALEEALADAQRKDAGADAATLGWVLSDMRLPAAAPGIPGGSAPELEAFREDLVRRLAAMALPAEPE